MITIVDYGMGNLGSILNMFKRIGVRAIVTSELSDINVAEKLLLPGVGSFDKAMEAINQSDLRAMLDKKVLEDKVPVLGVCLGMQLLTSGSDEGQQEGFNWIPGRASRFDANLGLKIPHMGWNVTVPAQQHPLAEGLGDDSRFYFVHSYCVQVENPNHCLFKTIYGQEFASGIQKGNIYGVQFHPEKSHKFGMKLLKNFVEL
jgi:glutamine amidotransferase